MNLLSNAVKYSHSGTIMVSTNIFLLPDGVPMAEIKVKDEGVGLKPEVLEKLFKPFAILAKEDVHHLTTSYGYGLSVCKQICNQLGGDIYAEQNAIKGSTFTFTMKLQIL